MENEERDRLLTELSGPAYDPGLDRDELLHELFEAVVDAGPDRPAIQLEGRILSYRQLDAQANRLAHALRQRDIGPDDMWSFGYGLLFAIGVFLYPLLIEGAVFPGMVFSASFLTSSATTANPRPASPARAASMAAFKAKRFV